ncbi:MAG: VOC family protein [Oscillatoriophycideae cyanobacterium NC_groundwater_1537_Pr4_S-0.65um_50_18]|nr:VOC family protein [Oscillatoriophycideae cyanobacterium NC_groundwater_1537_Pr4_S-0.65um_50_18]
MHLDRLDHLVLTVQNIQQTCEFYQQVLGMQVVTFGDNRKALRFGQQKINLHQAGHEFLPKAKQPTPGSADLCFITEMPLEQVMQHLQRCQIAIESTCEPGKEIVQRTGALGAIVSLYIRDPDGNLLEISNDVSDSSRL